MTPPFIIDTNALVAWWYNWYPPDRHDFWIAFERYAEANRVLIPEEVCEEVKTRFPELDEWLNPRKGLLMCPNSDDVDGHIIRLVNTYPKKLKLTAFQNNADLHVISTAALHQGCVFTDEKEARRRRDTGEIEGKFKIPDICRKEGIDWKRSHEIMPFLGGRFVLVDD